MAAQPSVGSLRIFQRYPWLHNFHHSATITTVNMQYRSSSLCTLASLSASSVSPAEESDNNEERIKSNTTTIRTADKPYGSSNADSKKTSYFPKRGQTLELVCESLAFKGKGVCKVSGTGFVVMSDRVLPGERFIGRVTRKKDNYAEVVEIQFCFVRNDLFACSFTSPSLSANYEEDNGVYVWGLMALVLFMPFSSFECFYPSSPGEYD